MIYQNQYPDQARTYSLSKQGLKKYLGPHFVLSEFACSDGSDIVLVHPMLVALLENIRARFGKAIIINSGYRTIEYNREIGGAKSSKHLLGMAADIRISGTPPEIIASYVDNVLKTGGVGRYPGFTHVDVFGSSRRWGG